MSESPLQTLGQHLQQLRLSRGISLSQLAADAGIAKSNLSKIEQGNSNPTLDTLWRIAVQLNIPFGNLVAPIDMAMGDESIQVRLLSQGRGTPSTDAYLMHCSAHSEHRSDAHLPGTRETLTLISGCLEAGTESNSQTLLPGDSFTFAASEAHFYRTGEQPATCLLTVIYHESETPS